MRRSPVAFLDKDGTLLVDVPYNAERSRMRLMPTVAEGAALLSSAGFRLAVVSNQSGVALGRFSEAALDDIECGLAELLAGRAELDGCFWCTHAADEGCPCRKPAPGLLIDAAERLDADLSRSWMIGDILDDVEAGHAAGCRAALVDWGGETEWRDGPLRRPDVTTKTFLDAARQIVATTRRSWW